MLLTGIIVVLFIAYTVIVYAFGHNNGANKIISEGEATLEKWEASEKAAITNFWTKLKSKL